MKVQVYIQGKRLDLYDDEQINVKQVIQDVQDISKIFGDFSQTFSVPASKTNNEIFKFWFNSDINNGFDSRLRVIGSIDVNTLDFKRGKFRLDSVEVKNNTATNYKITFFGDAIKVKDLLGNDKLRDLEWLSNFTHAYSGDVVKTGLTSGIDFTVDSVAYNKAICYPLISYQRQYFYDSDSSDDTGDEVKTNIHYQSGHSNGVDSKQLKPAIKLFLLIKAIEVKYGFKFNSPFFEDVKFTSAYMNLNNNVESLANGRKVYENLTGTNNVPSAVYYQYFTSVTPAAGFTTVGYKIKLTVNDEVVYEELNFQAGARAGGSGFSIPHTIDYTVKAEVITEESFDFTAATELRYSSAFAIVDIFTNPHTDSVVIQSNIPSLMPDIKVYDFLVSIFKTFNLIVEADGEDIFVNDLQSWYSDGQIYDITPYVDLEKENIKRGKIYRQIDFKFKESDQILAQQFSLSNGRNYGDFEFKLTDSLGEELEDVDGSVLSIESQFENPINERLYDINDGSLTSLQYCPYFDRDIKPIANDPFIFYAPITSVSSNSIGFLNDGVYEELGGNILMPSHSYLLDATSFNLNFNAEINEYTYEVMPNTIIKEYFLDYLTDMFSKKRRNYIYKAILPDYFLHKLKLNDRVIIKDKRYIINSIDSNLVNRKDKLELINDIYEAPLVSDVLNNSLFRVSSNVYTNIAQTHSISYIGLKGKTVQAYDYGDGSTFLNIITKTTLGNVFTVTFELSANVSGSNRTVGIQVIDSIKNPIFTILQTL